MNARGTRRPHARRPRPKPIKRSGGGGGGKSGCPPLLLGALGGLVAIVYAGAELVGTVL